MRTLFILGLSFCLFISFCNCETTTEAVEDESTEEEPLLSTLDIVVLGLAGKNTRNHFLQESLFLMIEKFNGSSFLIIEEFHGLSFL